MIAVPGEETGNEMIPTQIRQRITGNHAGQRQRRRYRNTAESGNKPKTTRRGGIARNAGTPAPAGTAVEIFNKIIP